MNKRLKRKIDLRFKEGKEDVTELNTWWKNKESYQRVFALLRRSRTSELENEKNRMKEQLQMERNNDHEGHHGMKNIMSVRFLRPILHY